MAPGCEGKQMNRTGWQWLKLRLRTITLVSVVCGLGLAALCVLRPAKPLPVSAGGESRPVPLNPLSGVSWPPVVDRVPRYGQIWAEGRFVDDLLVITDDGGANSVFEPHSRRLDSCDALESIGDIAPEASGLLACYGTAWEGQIAKAQCGGQALWTARLWSDPDREEDLDIRHVGTRVSAALAGLSLLLVVVLVIGVFPSLSRGLGWGRYGVPIEEPLRDLHDVTTLSGIPVPREATLVKGTIRWHDPNRYVYAVIEMPRAAAERYLKGEKGWKWEADPYLAEASSLPQQMRQGLAGKSGVVYLNGGGPPRAPYEAPAQTIAAVHLEQGDRALIYIYWMPVW
jgi:hypothetical protein